MKVEELRKRFSVIEDWRHSGYVVYELADVLVIVFCAILCGMKGLTDIHTYAENNAEYFQNALGLKHMISKAELGRILAALDGNSVGKVMVELLQEKLGSTGDVIAVDGKAIRSTSEEGKANSALQILTAYVTQTGVVLGQKSIHEKTNEIPVFQEMLEFLSIEKKVITADAMHCQRKTCEKVVDKKGDYVFGLKQNQPSLYNDVALYYESTDNPEELESFKTVEKNAGRIETRICRKMNDASWLLPRHDWPGLKTAFSVERIVNERGKETQETSYYITSMDTSAKELLRIVREHWKIESMHWMLDVDFSEDSCRFLSENAHKTLNAIRKCALAIHKDFLARTNKKTSIKANMLACLINRKLFFQLLGNL